MTFKKPVCVHVCSYVCVILTCTYLQNDDITVTQAIYHKVAEVCVSEQTDICVCVCVFLHVIKNQDFSSCDHSGMRMFVFRFSFIKVATPRLKTTDRVNMSDGKLASWSRRNVMT